MDILVDFEPMYPGFEFWESHDFFFYVFVLSLLLQSKFANSTLLSLLSFSYFITPYDAQASSAFSALISCCCWVFFVCFFLKIDLMTYFGSDMTQFQILFKQ